MTETVTKEAMPMEGLADFLRAQANAIGWDQSAGRVLREWAAEVEASRSLPVDGGVEPDDSWVAQVVSSGPHDFPLLQWRNADVSFSVPIGSKLYAAALAGAPAVQEREVLREALLPFTDFPAADLASLGDDEAYTITMQGRHMKAAVAALKGGQK